MVLAKTKSVSPRCENSEMLAVETGRSDRPRDLGSNTGMMQFTLFITHVFQGHVSTLEVSLRITRASFLRVPDEFDVLFGDS